MRLLPLAPIVALALVAPAGLAQQREAAMEAGPGAAGKAWVKLCETPASAGKDLFGKDRVVGAKTCLTHHERVDANSGTVLIAAGVRQTGVAQQLTITVAGVQQGAGLRVLIYPADLWVKAQRKERLDKQETGRLGDLKLRLAFCHRDGCTAEIDATPSLVSDLKSNAGLVVFALRSGQPIALPIPLSGFREAYDGPPVDSVRFHRARDELLRQIRDRQKQGERRQGDEPRR